MFPMFYSCVCLDIFIYFVCFFFFMSAVFPRTLCEIRVSHHAEGQHEQMHLVLLT